VLKDNIALAGIPVQNGGVTDWVPNFDATLVTRILDAGGVITGKAGKKTHLMRGDQTKNLKCAKQHASVLSVTPLHLVRSAIRMPTVTVLGARVVGVQDLVRKGSLTWQSEQTKAGQLSLISP